MDRGPDGLRRGDPRARRGARLYSPLPPDGGGLQGSLNPGYPQYLGREDFHTVYLNLIGPPTPLLQLLSFEHFAELRAAGYVLRDLPLLIHCNRGESRAQSLAVLSLSTLVYELPVGSCAAIYIFTNERSTPANAL